MNKNTWPEDDRIEYDQLVDESLIAPAVADRRERFLAGLDDAVQAHRLWAIDTQASIRNDGADKILRREQEARKPRVPVAHNGSVLGKAPREMGRKVRGDDGKVVHARGLFDYLTWDELREKRAEFARAELAAAVDKHAVDKLLSLEERVPGTANPAAACEQLGTTIEAYLLAEDAA